VIANPAALRRVVTSILDPRRSHLKEISMTASARLIEDYLAGPAALRQAVAGLGAEALRAHPVPGTWSILEVVCHLVDSEQAYCHRMKRVIAEDQPVLPGYDETRFAGSLAYHERELEQELALLEGMRQQMARILRTLPGSAWSRTGMHTERGVMSLQDLLQTEADHIPHHLTFIEAKRRALSA
jgi:uncharacterized damage-inducible protein DinB